MSVPSRRFAGSRTATLVFEPPPRQLPKRIVGSFQSTVGDAIWIAQSSDSLGSQRLSIARPKWTMTRTVVTRSIKAPINLVFKTVSEIENFSKAIPHIMRVEFLSENKSGIGARFRETRLMRGKEVSTELEVTEFVQDSHVRLVADSHGTVWDTLFEVSPNNGGTELTMTMDARAYRLLPKILNPLMKGMVRRAIEQDMDMVKSFCEG